MHYERTHISFLFDKKVDLSKLQNFNTKILTSDETTAYFYDTFDCELEHKSFFLEYSYGRFSLIDFDNLKVKASCKQPYKTYLKNKDIKCKILREKLENLTNGKILIEKNKFLKTEQKLLFTDKDDKTTFEAKRIIYHSTDDDDDFTIDFIDFGRPRICNLKDELEEEFDIFFENYDPTVIYNLTSSSVFRYYSIPTPLSGSLRTYIFDIIQKYISYLDDFAEFIKKDIDTEFLHKLRVDTRKLRAYLNYTKKYFPEIFKKTDNLLKNFLKKSNILRDLDVLLLNKDKVLRKIAETHHNFDTSNIFEKIKKIRQEEFNKFVDYLNSQDFENFKTELNKQLSKIADKKQSKLIELENKINKIAKKNSKKFKTSEEYTKFVKSVDDLEKKLKSNLKQKIQKNLDKKIDKIFYKKASKKHKKELQEIQKDNQDISKMMKKIIRKKAKELIDNEKFIIEKRFDKLHKIRIKVKYLRYNIAEFILYDNEDDYDEAINALKKYQNFLGEITDWNAWHLPIIMALNGETSALQNFELDEQTTTQWLEIHRKTMTTVSKLFQ